MTKSIKILPLVTASAAVTGALIGGTVAAVRGTVDVKKGKMTGNELAKTVVSESAGTGLATAAGVAATGVLGIGGFVGLIGFTVVATSTKILWDKAVRPYPKSTNSKIALKSS